MKIPIKLNDLLQQTLAAISATSTLMGLGNVQLDCSEVESLTDEQLEALFSNIPEEWGCVELGEVFDSDTLTESFAKQLSNYINRRLGASEDSTAILHPETDSDADTATVKSSNPLDIFELRNEVISD